MKKIYHLVWVLTCILAIVFYPQNNAHSNASGAPVGKTGSPGDGFSTCAGCHGGGLTPGLTDYFGIIVEDELTVFSAGETYEISVQATQVGATVFGFELKAEDNNGNSIGDLIVTNTATTQLVGSGDYITHTSVGTIGLNNIEWTFDWQAPADYDGEVTFYAAGNLANGNGTGTGDVIMTDSYSITVSSGGATEIEGCTDPDALNYNPLATIDDGSCQYGDCVVVTVSVTTGSFPTEISWSLVNNFGVEYLEGASASSSEDVCLPYGEYTFNAYDTFGDGWNGGVYQISTFCNDVNMVLANNGGETPTNGTNTGDPVELESTEIFMVTECTTCTGFSVSVLTTYESTFGTNDATASIVTNSGNSPFEVLWSNGQTGDFIDGLSAGLYSVTVTDAEGCIAESTFEIIVDPLEYNIDDFDMISSCGGTLFDSGGADEDYMNNENQQITIYPSNSEEYVSLYFSSFDLEASYDFLTIYDGEDINAPVLAASSATLSFLNEIYYASQTNESRALTLTFTSDGSVTKLGWVAELGCTTYGPCFGFDIEVLATFETEEGTSDASASLDISFGNQPFEYLWSTGETSESITGLTAGTYSVTITDSEDCIAESTFEVIVDPEEYIIGEIINVNTCNGLFYDTGGSDNNPGTGEDMFIRICPDEEGFVSQLEFTEFNVGWYGLLTVYDGMGTTNPVLATGSFTDLLGQTIVASAENSTGCLTVTYTSDIWFEDVSGWVANISCYDYIVYGCMDTEAFNYNDEAEEEDGSCYYSPGCIDSTFVEYYIQGFIADHDDGSCETTLIDDCFDELALNYNPYSNYNVNGDPCVYDLESWTCGGYFRDSRDNYTYLTVEIGEQCWLAENVRYLPEGASTMELAEGATASQLEDGFIYSGVDAYNPEDNGRYYSWAIADDVIPFGWHLPSNIEWGELSALEITNGISLQENGGTGFEAVLSGGAGLFTETIGFLNVDASSIFWTSKELDPSLAFSRKLMAEDPIIYEEPQPKDFAFSVRAIFGFEEGSVLGCTDEDYLEYNSQANLDDGSCQVLVVLGCTDDSALNYDTLATVNDGSCIEVVVGCMDDGFAEYYEQEANVDDGSCSTPVVFGCIDQGAFNYNQDANVNDGTCIDILYGCTNDNYLEFNPDANVNDGSCETVVIYGCMDLVAFNYNSAANVDDGSCQGVVMGCMNPNYVEFNALANTEDGSCSIEVVYGCTIDYALNYESWANTDDGSCEVEGCTNPLFVEYDEFATIDNGTCAIAAIFGCTDELYIEYFAPANMDDGSCETLIFEGCTDFYYLEFDPNANVDDGSCVNLATIGCTDSNFLEYNPEATIDDNTCQTPVVLGCMDEAYLEYFDLANTDNGSCLTPIVEGCTNPNFLEYDDLANTDDGSCTIIILEGCMNPEYIEFNPNANVDNDSCEILVVYGCTDVLAFNYNEDANTNDGSCIPVIEGCLDDYYFEYNPEANTDDGSCVNPVIFGCTDPLALNYFEAANTDDGTCYYYLVEIIAINSQVGMIEFNAIVLGMGTDYSTFWQFGDGGASYEHDPIHNYTENGSYEVSLIVSDGNVEIIEVILVEIINLSLDDVVGDKLLVKVEYFDLMGRKVGNPKDYPYQVLIEKYYYDDGTIKVNKRLNL